MAKRTGDEAQQQDAAANNPDKWRSMLEDLKKNSGGGPFYFIKEGRTQVHLVPEGDSDSFFVEVMETHFDKPKPKYVVQGVLLKIEGGDIPDRFKNKIIPIVIPKTVFSGIVELLAEGYDLLDPLQGHAISIRRSGSGLATEYAVTASPRPIALDVENLAAADNLLDELPEIYANRQVTQKSSDEAAGDPGW